MSTFALPDDVLDRLRAAAAAAGPGEPVVLTDVGGRAVFTLSAAATPSSADEDALFGETWEETLRRTAAEPKIPGEEAMEMFREAFEARAGGRDDG